MPDGREADVEWFAKDRKAHLSCRLASTLRRNTEEADRQGRQKPQQPEPSQLGPAEDAEVVTKLEAADPLWCYLR